MVDPYVVSLDFSTKWPWDSETGKSADAIGRGLKIETIKK
jgi:hypothetical protein